MYGVRPAEPQWFLLNSGESYRLLTLMWGQEENCPNENFSGDPSLGPSLAQIKDELDFSSSRFWARIRQLWPPSALSLQRWGCACFKPLSFKVICYRATGNSMLLEGRCGKQGLQGRSSCVLGSFSLAHPETSHGSSVFGDVLPWTYIGDDWVVRAGPLWLH